MSFNHIFNQSIDYKIQIFQINLRSNMTNCGVTRPAFFAKYESSHSPSDNDNKKVYKINTTCSIGQIQKLPGQVSRNT